MMKKIIFFLAFILVLPGCVTTGPQESFVQAPSSAFQPIVQDAVSQMVLLYPPARTELVLKRSSDGFGKLLLESLRRQGYSIVEISPSKSTFHYVLDMPGTQLLRLTLRIGSETLTRAYTFENEVVVPISVWTRAEGKYD